MRIKKLNFLSIIVKMAITYIEKFNFYLKTFINELNVIFPEYKILLNDSYKTLLDSDSSDSLEYVKEYMENIKTYHNYLAKKDENLFKLTNELNFVKGIDFRNVWAKDIDNKTRESIWKYLQTLVVLGKKIVGDDDEIDTLLQNLNSEGKLENLKEETENMMEMLQNMNQMKQDPEENPESTDNKNNANPFEGGLINDIAKELTNELNLDNLNIGEPQNMNEAFNNLLGGGNSGNFLNLINKVGEKIQNKVQSGSINQNDLMKEAQNMMGNLKNPEQMAKNMMKNNNPTRDRLRKKLEKKKQGK